MASQPNGSKKSSVISAFLISLILITITFFAVINKQLIIDQISYWQYQPTSEISNLVSRIDFNNYGKFIFYSSQPKLDGTQNFNSECNRVEATTSILGCYSNGRIYIYNVTDKTLDGVREVTAAHETLHAIYARMSSSEKSEVDKLVEAEYDKLKGDQAFADMIAYYDRSEPGQRNNELHSMIGTEVADISTQLEAHYKKYFTDRQKIVALNKQYISVFKTLKSKAAELSAQLDALSADITAKTNQYNADINTLNNDIDTFNVRATSGDFTSQSQFNYERSVLASRAAVLESTRQDIQSDMSNYDSILAEYNSIASESQKLYNTIDSLLASPSSL